jgi:RHS repeat-associated protein
MTCELLQNTFRDFDPAIGNYVESDLEGLAAGVNTYAYVGENPLTFIDPDGLDETVINNTSGGRPW